MKFVDAPKIISFGHMNTEAQLFIFICSKAEGGEAFFPPCVLIYYHGDLIGQLL